ncbi:PAS domain S-box protein [Nostoc sp. FACHB-152]|uniref:PAS domain S-box protein n=1 Tax=unclassified Nostoc TaxID=2593658 RepID=UPI0016839E8A|nr:MULTISPECIES: PAS domain S-box protein [unclassified Nostoc]MBD2449035.1 PAS domain S-box protein [Nostoc sp. FACHB-152]MBD2469766.1 PAS domain S-box protein [Nostoc sp. FACHB-145]
MTEAVIKSLSDMKQETDVPVVITDQQGFVTYVNDCFTSVFGWSMAEISGQIITVVIPQGFHAPHHLGFSRFLSTESSTILNHPLRLLGITKDGREIEAEHLIMAEKHQGEWVFMAMLRPL